jgi:hypothetical protein
MRKYANKWYLQQLIPVLVLYQSSGYIVEVVTLGVDHIPKILAVYMVRLRNGNCYKYAMYAILRWVYIHISWIYVCHIGMTSWLSWTTVIFRGGQPPCPLHGLRINMYFYGFR